MSDQTPSKDGSVAASKYLLGFKDGHPATLEDLQAEVGKGWAGIVARLAEDLDKMGWNGHVVQIKEKFGDLRFYPSTATAEMYDRIDQAALESSRTCEYCGEPGLPTRKGGWIKTLCDGCNEAKEKQKEKA